MRLFVAIEIPADIRVAFGVFIKELRIAQPQAKWVRAENLHVTLKFLGNTEPEKLQAVQTALSPIRSEQSVHLEFRGSGFFPNEKKPRVFWAGLQASSNLAELAARIDEAMHGLNFPLERRPFVPHLTLARFEPPEVSPKLLNVVRLRTLDSFGSLTATEFHLIESKLKPAGAEYTTVQTVRFAPGG
jgi:2'-5' RNA ligase